MEITELYTKDVHESGAEMQVRDPSGKLTEIYFQLVGVDSQRWADIKREWAKDIAAKTEKSDAHYYAMTFVGWRGLSKGGQEIPFSEKLAEDILTNAPYLIRQCDEFIREYENFLPPA